MPNDPTQAAILAELQELRKAAKRAEKDKGTSLGRIIKLLILVILIPIAAVMIYQGLKDYNKLERLQGR